VPQCQNGCHCAARGEALDRGVSGQSAVFSRDSLAKAPLELLLKSCEELLVLHKYLESILGLP